MSDLTTPDQPFVGLDPDEKAIVNTVASVSAFLCHILEFSKIPFTGYRDRRFFEYFGDPLNWPLEQYVLRFVAFGQVKSEVLMLAVVYLRRMITKHPDLVICEYNIRRLFAIATSIADKFLNDTPYPSNWWYTEIALLPRMFLRTQMDAEIEFSELLEWDLNCYDLSLELTALGLSFLAWETVPRRVLQTALDAPGLVYGTDFRKRLPTSSQLPPAETLTHTSSAVSDAFVCDAFVCEAALAQETCDELIDDSKGVLSSACKAEVSKLGST